MPSLLFYRSRSSPVSSEGGAVDCELTLLTFRSFEKLANELLFFHF